jgi:hypothetical protein
MATGRESEIAPTRTPLLRYGTAQTLLEMWAARARMAAALFSEGAA